MKILCIHGVGHGDANIEWRDAWAEAVAEGMRPWGLAPQALEFHFSLFDDLFEDADLHAGTVVEALARLAASGLFYGLVDLFRSPRGLDQTLEDVRWTAGMVAQWVADEALREACRERIGGDIARLQPDLILAHSLGSLIAYDTLRTDEMGAKTLPSGPVLVSFGSQIGNPAVRRVFGGRIAELGRVDRWWHLYNEHDDVFTCAVHPSTRERFEQVDTHFDIEGLADHDGAHYLAHEQAGIRVWQSIATASRALAGTSKRVAAKARAAPKLPEAVKPQARALLVGIAEYPDAANNLGGPVNDVFLMSSVLQELGFEPDSIRVVLNDRATTSGIRERLAWLLDDARDGDKLFFFFAGHGTQVPTYGRDAEVDRIDECLVPYDFDWRRDQAITDNEFAALYSKLPYGAQFMAVLDCCHSGGMERAATSGVRGLSPPDDIRHRAVRWNPASQMWEPRAKLETRSSTSRMRRKDDQVAWVGKSGAVRRIGRASGLWVDEASEFDRLKAQYGHYGPFVPILFEACAEDEKAREYRHGAVSHGAFTFALCQTLRTALARGDSLSFDGVMRSVRQRVKKVVKEKQTPQLLCAKRLRSAAFPGLGGGK